MTNQITNTVNTDEITFGIEVECYVPTATLTANRVHVGSYHNGLPVVGIPALSGWKAERDGSLGSHSGYTAVEFVSPVLKGKAGFDAVFAAYDLLFNEWGAIIDRNCGTHVTVGINEAVGTGDKRDYISRLVKLVSQNESGLFGICNSINRLSNYYCASLKGDWTHEATEAIKRDNAAWVGNTDYSSRYSVLNLQHVNQGSASRVEFRVFAATKTPIKAVGYVATALGLVHLAAVQGHVRKFDSSANKDFGKALTKMHKRLNWVAYRTTMNFKCGWPTDAFAAYGRDVMKNQRSQSKRFQQRVAR